MKKKVKKPVKKSARAKRSPVVKTRSVEDIQTRAYLLAESDNFQNSPESYWLMSERGQD
jgi:hypothetical protein